MDSGSQAILYGLVWAALALNAAISLWLGTRSLPAALRRELRETLQVANEAHDAASECQQAWDREKIALAAIVEQMEGVAETIEKRRARIAAANQRAEQRNHQAADEDPKMALRRRAGLI